MPQTSTSRRRDSFNSLEIARFRLTRHHLLSAGRADAVALARDVCGIQAQVMSAAFLQFWTRNHAITRAEIETDLWRKRSLVKTSLMRQTLHVVPADAFPVYIAALRSSRVAGALRIMSKFKISREEAGALTTLIMDALSSGPLGRAAIAAAVRPKVSQRVRAWMEKVWSIVRVPVAEGLICYGRGEGNEVTFIRADQWLGKRQPVAEEQARMELLRAYLRAYGPATLTDFSHWSGMPAGEVRPLPEFFGNELVEIEVEKKNCLLLREDLGALGQDRNGTDCVRLLPYFDPYLLAHREKDHLVEARHYKRVYRNQGWISPVVLLDGSVAGVWSHRRQGQKLQVSIEPLQKLTRTVRAAVTREAEALAGFFESTLDLAIRSAGTISG
jgi:Winged helix DNA-binding domain